MTSRCVIKKDNERVYEKGTEKLVFKLTAKDTGGVYSQIERVVSAKFQSPPDFHAHRDNDWSCYVIKGELEFYFHGSTMKLTPGQSIYVPRDTFFRWANPLDTPALALFTYTPGGFEEFFAEVLTYAPSSDRIDHYEDTLQFILKTQDKYGMYRE